MAITDDHDERALIEAAQADPARFVDLYERHFHRVYAYAIRRTASRAEAEDITSEVFERALVNMPRFEWRGVPLIAWLYRIAANAMADRRQQIERNSADPPPEVPDESESATIERRAMLFQLVDRLPDLQRQVIEMAYFYGMTRQEIAEATGEALGTIHTRARLALQKLRGELERDEFEG